MKVLIKNSNVVFSDCTKKKDLLLENKKITKIEDSLEEKDAKIVDAAGLFCMPGLIDIHVHLRDPGFLEKETVKTGAKAAAKGGVTSLCCMANTKPVIDSLENLAILKNKIEKENIDIYPIAAITKNLEGKELVNFKDLSRDYVFGFSDDGFFVENSKLFKEAMEKVKDLNLKIFSHCEEKKLLPDKASEGVAIAKTIALSLATNCPIHICHVSTKQSIMLIKAAKEIGVKITAETAPHYFYFTEENINNNPNFKMNPPLRSIEDKKAVEAALLDETLNCIATDHAPHEPQKKSNFKTALNGVVGLETFFSATITNFYCKKKTSLQTISKLISKNPAKILGIKNKGEIIIGYDADLVLADLNKSFILKEEDLISKSKNSPFIGEKLTGQIVKTFKKGDIVYSLK